MRKIREVLRLKHHQGLSNRAVAAACCIGAATVHEYLGRAAAAGISWPLPESLGDAEIEALLFPVAPRSQHTRALPDFDHIARELRRKGVTLFLLWEEYHRVHPQGYGYSRFCELYREYAGRLEPRLRQTHRAGEKLFVDYAGHTIAVLDRVTGETRQAQVFVATLGASDYTYAEATWTQSLQDWIGSHVRAFEFFGGVPEIVVPDNLKAGVTSPCYYEPDLNPSYREMADYYNVAVIPTRVAKPRDKAKVENHVLQVERRVLAPLRDRAFLSLEECNRAIAERGRELNERPFQQLAGSRRQLFEATDLPALRPLPLEPYCFAFLKTARVSVDYHLAIDHCFYSVPYTLVREEVQMRLTEHTVEVFHRRQRCKQPNRHVTLAVHMPTAHKEYLEWTPQRLVQWARKTGHATAGVVETIMGSRTHPQQGFRSCLGIMRLGKVHGDDRLEAACARALQIGSPSYKSVQSILQSKLDQQALAPRLPLACPDHSNIRGAGYYQTGSHENANLNKEKHHHSC